MPSFELLPTLNPCPGLLSHPKCMHFMPRLTNIVNESEDTEPQAQKRRDSAVVVLS